MSCLNVAICIDIEPTRLVEPLLQGPPAKDQTSTGRIKSKMTTTAAIDRVVNRAVVLECPGPSVQAKAHRTALVQPRQAHFDPLTGRITSKRRQVRIPAPRDAGTIGSPLTDAPRCSVTNGPLRKFRSRVF
jgi:hypothetical protein